MFHGAFPAFPWEVLEVYTGPPKVAFSWRHWGRFTGKFKGHQGNGEMIEIFGFAIIELNNDSKICNTEVYFNTTMFVEVLEGKRPASDLTLQAKNSPLYNEK